MSHNQAQHFIDNLVRRAELTPGTNLRSSVLEIPESGTKFWLEAWHDAGQDQWQLYRHTHKNIGQDNIRAGFRRAEFISEPGLTLSTVIHGLYKVERTAAQHVAGQVNDSQIPKGMWPHYADALFHAGVILSTDGGTFGTKIGPRFIGEGTFSLNDAKRLEALSHTQTHDFHLAAVAQQDKAMIWPHSYGDVASARRLKSVHATWKTDQDSNVNWSDLQRTGGSFKLGSIDFLEYLMDNRLYDEARAYYHLFLYKDDNFFIPDDGGKLRQTNYWAHWDEIFRRDMVEFFQISLAQSNTVKNVRSIRPRWNDIIETCYHHNSWRILGYCAAHMPGALRDYHEDHDKYAEFRRPRLKPLAKHVDLSTARNEDVARMVSFYLTVKSGHHHIEQIADWAVKHQDSTKLSYAVTALMQIKEQQKDKPYTSLAALFPDHILQKIVARMDADLMQVCADHGALDDIDETLARKLIDRLVTDVIYGHYSEEQYDNIISILVPHLPDQTAQYLGGLQMNGAKTLTNLIAHPASCSDVLAAIKQHGSDHMGRAIEGNDPRLARIVLSSGWDINSIDEQSGLSFLALSIDRMRPEIIRDFLAAGADLDAAGKGGKSARDIITLRGCKDIIDSLQTPYTSADQLSDEFRPSAGTWCRSHVYQAPDGGARIWREAIWDQETGNWCVVQKTSDKYHDRLRSEIICHGELARTALAHVEEFDATMLRLGRSMVENDDGSHLSDFLSMQLPSGCFVSSLYQGKLRSRRYPERPLIEHATRNMDELVTKMGKAHSMALSGCYEKFRKQYDGYAPASTKQLHKLLGTQDVYDIAAHEFTKFCVENYNNAILFDLSASGLIPDEDYEDVALRAVRRIMPTMLRMYTSQDIPNDMARMKRQEFRQQLQSHIWHNLLESLKYDAHDFSTRDWNVRNFRKLSAPLTGEHKQAFSDFLTADKRQDIQDKFVSALSLDACKADSAWMFEECVRHGALVTGEHLQAALQHGNARIVARALGLGAARDIDPKKAVKLIEGLLQSGKDDCAHALLEDDVFVSYLSRKDVGYLLLSQAASQAKTPKKEAKYNILYNKYNNM